MDKIYRALVDGGAGKYFRKHDDAINYCVDFVMKNQDGELTKDEVKSVLINKGRLKYMMKNCQLKTNFVIPSFVEVKEFELN